MAQGESTFCFNRRKVLRSTVASLLVGLRMSDLHAQEGAPNQTEVAKSMQNMVTLEKSSTPLWKTPLLVWLKSEFLQSENFLRLGGTLPEFDGASWPLGARLADVVDGNVDWKAGLDVIDAEFHERVLRAWQLPWHYSQLPLHSPSRRDDANFVITNVGNWNKQPRQYDDIASLLASRRINWGPDATLKSTYAITPFSLASQYWVESKEAPWQDGQIIYTDVVVFYTFETYVQETLARTAFDRGASPAQIARSYEHIYCNSRPSFDAVPTDLAELQLARLANPRVEWDELRTTAKNARANSRQSGPQALPRFRRQALFGLRLDLHLTVALAAACHGLQGFREPGAESPLVRVSERPPSRDEVVAHWLGHMLGTYDHAAACEHLLVRLAQRYDRKLSEVSQAGPDLNGITVPEFEGRSPVFSMPRTPAEREVVRAGLRSVRDAGHHEGFDRFRWGVFEPSLDDASMRGDVGGL
jgi:hypothetical protein